MDQDCASVQPTRLSRSDGMQNEHIEKNVFFRRASSSVSEASKPTVWSGEYSGVYRNSNDLGVRVHFETVDSVCPLQVATHIRSTHTPLQGKTYA